ncbi:tail fiber assembly protein [Pokkaliibacter sp. MBI-7]|uniref:tail fiber assembly protein n=1 Tax=Pokkaliibacter sp. MBI-7 TaxID=3040600 RepID=UPI002448E0AC|nr:tail fiber assembly protein [Pokkaliibacter sp. MBI-7]MDH2435578.1 tail fiber assembly protein [Pokkaliibacter sp. MBI-7]
MTYIHNGQYHTDYSEQYMAEQGIDAEDRAAILAQRTFELSGLADQLRAKRNHLLQQADNLINKAIDNGDDPQALRAYRQALRDVPEQEGFPEEVGWPALPALT